MKEFFENLKAKRLEKDLSLEDIHRKSRLPLMYLKAIEAGQMADLPKGYDRIYLRRYAKEIGLDEAEVLRDYDLFTGKLPPAEPAPPAPETKPDNAVKRPAPPPAQKAIRSYTDNLNLDRLHKIFWISLAAIIIIGLGYFTIQQYQYHQSSKNLEIKEIPISQLIENETPADSSDAVAKDSARSSVLLPQDAPITIELRGVIDRTWIGEIRDGKDTTDYFITRGVRHAVTARQQVELKLGRANGVEIWLNGRNMGVADTNDVVLTLMITREGIVRKF